MQSGAKTVFYICTVDLQQTYTFAPLAFETLGPINVKGVKFLQEVGRSLAAISDNNRQTSFLFQRIFITLQRFNAITFADIFAKTHELETVSL